MRKLPTIVAGGVVAAAMAAGIVTTGTGAVIAQAATTTTSSSSSTTSTTLAPPAQGNGGHKLFLYVDTVNGGQYKPNGDCAMNNVFQPGQTVVFRMDGVEIATGGTDLTGQTVRGAFVKIPGEKNQTLYFGNHGKTSYWTAGWAIPKNYPLGTVNFTVWVTTKAVPASPTQAAVPAETGVFSQAGLAPPSRLTIVKA
jgi:hypothetical protein